MKNILILQSGDIDFSVNALSGTSKCSYQLFQYLTKYYNVWYALDNVYNAIYKNIISINNIDLNIKYDLLIVCGDYSLFDKLYSKYDYINSKKIFIVQNHIMNDDQFYILHKYKVDKIILVSDYAYDCTKQYIDKYKFSYKVIYNPVDVNYYKEIYNQYANVDKKDIIIPYHPWKGNISEFINNIFPIIRKNIDCDLWLCYPEYFNNIIFENIVGEVNNSHIHILNYLSTDDLIRLYKKSKISWCYTSYPETFSYTIVESILCNAIPINGFIDATKCVVSKDLQNKLTKNTKNSCSEFNDEQMANYIIDLYNNYDNYIDDLNKEHQYIFEHYNSSYILNQYFEVIKELINIL